MPADSDPLALFPVRHALPECINAAGDFVSRAPLFGRGFSTFLPSYRILDNQYLMTILDTGFVGLAAYLFMVLSVVATAHRTILARDRIRSDTALAAAASAVAFAISTVLFDVLSFPQAPYLFFFVAGLAVVAASPLSLDPLRARRPGTAPSGLRGPPLSEPALN